MRVIRSMMLSAVLLVLTGCAATGPLYKDVAASIPPVPAGKGRIFFYRSDTIFGAAMTSDIRLNDKVVGRSERGSFFYVDTMPGNYAVATSTEVERRLTFTLATGKTRYVKTTVSMGALVGRINPELVNADVGKSDIQELHYTGGTALSGK